ncbi:unnamed protein product, partial [Ectocarpus sp. 12 AP-2014]
GPTIVLVRSDGGQSRGRRAGQKALSGSAGSRRSVGTNDRKGCCPGNLERFPEGGARGGPARGGGRGSEAGRKPRRERGAQREALGREAGGRGPQGRPGQERRGGGRTQGG